jgi:chorismate synthase
MPNNQFGELFSYTTWGESHGKAIGCVIDGCPSGVPLTVDDLQKELDKRRPGQKKFTSARNERDQVEILSGVFEGFTTGAPISLLIPNEDNRSQDYSSIANNLRPGHANYTYLEKYGIFDYRGGGRSSARETACRVAAGAVAKQFLKKQNIHIACYLKQVGSVSSPLIPSLDSIPLIEKSELFCWHKKSEENIQKLLLQTLEEKDSIGGLVECVIFNPPIGLGEPIYNKIEALLAKAMLSLPASKGFEIGEGFRVAQMKGSEHNDEYKIENNEVSLSSNHSGGTLGGISTGQPINFRVAFKPTSSIHQNAKTVNFLTKKNETILLSNKGRHDPCLSIRAVPCVEAMTSLVIADLVLHKRLNRNLTSFSAPINTQSSMPCQK